MAIYSWFSIRNGGFFHSYVNVYHRVNIMSLGITTTIDQALSVSANVGKAMPCAPSPSHNHKYIGGIVWTIPSHGWFIMTLFYPPLFKVFGNSITINSTTINCQPWSSTIVNYCQLSTIIWIISIVYQLLSTILSTIVLYLDNSYLLLS
jgi:hypothetical protein